MSQPSPSPFAVAVVVPVYNRPQQIGTCLRSLFAQDYPRERFEIIVVDDGSTDATAEVARAVCAEWAGATRILHQANGGPGSARNAGYRATEAPLVAFLDSDCVVTPDWLSALVGALTETGADGVGGPIVGAPPRRWVDGYLVACDFYRHRVKHGQVDYLITISMAVRRAALVAVGGFAAHAGIWSEDADLSLRLRRAGYRLAVTERGTTTHGGTPDSVRALAKELYRYGVGNAALSHQWGQRPPWRELLRHGAAAIAAPYLALRLARRAGVARALAFWPLIVIEHGAFCAGLVGGMRRRGALIAEGHQMMAPRVR